MSFFFPTAQSVLPPGENEVWFEYRGVPLKWHIPTGLLFDLLSEGEGENPKGGTEGSAAAAQDAKEKGTQAYPWCLTIHFRSYPRDILLPSGPDSLQATYFNSLKEAAYVLTGSSQAVMSLTKNSQRELWKNVLEAQDADFFANINKMELGKPTRSRIPIRIYARDRTFDSFTGWKSIDYASKSLQVTTALPMVFLRPCTDSLVVFSRLVCF